MKIVRLLAQTMWATGFVLAGALNAADAPAVVGLTDQEIKLGMVNAQSGPASGLGLGMKAGAEAYFSEVNAKGGIHGRKINLLVGDDGYEPNQAVDATLKMIEDAKVFSLFGYVGTPTGNAVIPIVKETHTPLVGLFTGAMTLRSPVTQEIINIRASYDDEAEKIVDSFIRDKGAKKFAVFYQDDGFGLAVLSSTEKALKKRAMDVVAKATFQRNTTAVKAGLASILAAAPDVVVMVGPYTPIAAFVKQAKVEGLKARMVTVSFVGTDNLVALVGTDGNGVVISQVVPSPSDTSVPIVKECSDALAKAGGKLNYVSLEGCITAKAMVIGLEKAGKDLSQAGLIKSFEGISNLDIGGMTMSLSASDHQAFDKVFLSQIKDGIAVSVSGIDK
jgi:branched-chain amino acid transport system substrate-binding protein